MRAESRAISSSAVTTRCFAPPLRLYLTRYAMRPPGSQARRASVLKSALGPLTDLLDDPRVVEVMLNADGVVWVERVSEGVVRTRLTVARADADARRARGGR